MFQREGMLETVALRFFNVFGPRQKVEKLPGTGFAPACDFDEALAATAKWFAGR